MFGFESAEVCEQSALADKYEDFEQIYTKAYIFHLHAIALLL